MTVSPMAKRIHSSIVGNGRGVRAARAPAFMAQWCCVAETERRHSAVADLTTTASLGEVRRREGEKATGQEKQKKRAAFTTTAR